MSRGEFIAWWEQVKARGRALGLYIDSLTLDELARWTK